VAPGREQPHLQGIVLVERELQTACGVEVLAVPYEGLVCQSWLVSCWVQLVGHLGQAVQNLEIGLHSRLRLRC
jgi:hypothetical protein